MVRTKCVSISPDHRAAAEVDDPNARLPGSTASPTVMIRLSRIRTVLTAVGGVHREDRAVG
jgi:hypothetical protein